MTYKKEKITKSGTYQIEVYSKRQREEWAAHWGKKMPPIPETYPIQVTRIGDGWHAHYKADICTSKPHKTAESAIGTVKRLIIKAGV